MFLRRFVLPSVFPLFFLNSSPFRFILYFGGAKTLLGLVLLGLVAFAQIFTRDLDAVYVLVIWIVWLH